MEILRSFADMGALHHPNLSNVGVALLGADGRILQHNEVLAVQIGFEQADLRGKCMPLTCVSPVDRPMLLDAVSQMLAGQIQKVSMRLRLQTRYGDKEFRALVIPLLDRTAGRVTRFVWASSHLPPAPLLICP
jgi:PAS domain S-box-containing protein